MNGNLGVFDLVVFGLIAFFLLFSFINGMRRGVIRSFIRLLIVALCAVAALFMAQPIASYLLNMDLTQFNIVIEGETMTGSIQDMIMALITEAPEIADILEMAPTLKDLIVQIPVVVVAIVVFIIFFWVLKIVSIIPYCIIKIFIPKRNADGTKKKKHRFLGFLVSILQIAVVMSVLLIPTVGVINTLDELAPTIDAMMEVEEDSDESFQKMLSGFVNESTVYSFLGQSGVKDFYLACFNKLANINLSGVDASLFEEVAKVADFVSSITNMTNAEGDISVGGLTEMLDKATESEVVMQTLSDILITNASALSNGETVSFAGAELSVEDMVGDDEEAQQFVQDFLGTFTEENEDQVKAGVTAISGALNAATEYLESHPVHNEDGTVADHDSFEVVVGELITVQESFLEDVENGVDPNPEEEALMRDVYGAIYDSGVLSGIIPQEIIDALGLETAN